MASFDSTAFDTTAFSSLAFFFDGESPDPPSHTEVTGGGLGMLMFEHFRDRRRRKKREEIEAEVEDIQDEQSREIAKLLREQEEKDAERAELARIQVLADHYAQKGVDTPRPLLASVMKAHEERTRNALEQLQREIQRMLEEEEQAIVSLLLMDD